MKSFVQYILQPTSGNSSGVNGTVRPKKTVNLVSGEAAVYLSAGSIIKNIAVITAVGAPLRGRESARRRGIFIKLSP